MAEGKQVAGRLVLGKDDDLLSRRTRPELCYAHLVRADEAVERVLPEGFARARLDQRGITFIVPYRANRTIRKHEDGRGLRRYRRRWIIERTFAWFGSFRRLLIRHDRFTSMYRAFMYFAAALIPLRRF